MGQVLVITVQQNKKDIAKIYYHWSAYTSTAFKEAKQLVNNCFTNDNYINDIQLRMIHYLESQGGGILGGIKGDEGKYIQSLYPEESFSDRLENRNLGLIAWSEKGMQEIQAKSDYNMIIDLDNQTIQNFVYSIFNNIDDFNKDRKEWMEEYYIPLTIDDLTLVEHNPVMCSFDEIDSRIEMVKDKEHIYYNGQILTVIE